MIEYVSQVDFLQLEGVFEDAMQTYTILNEKPIDLILLDIEMPRLSGIDFVKSVKNLPHIIFTTAYPKYALIGFELDVVDYLVKPVAFPRFLKAVNKVRELVSAKNEKSPTLPLENGHFFVKENGKFTKINYEDVLFVEAMQNYVAIYLTGKKLISYITLSLLEKQLPESQFMKVHKSYIVSLQKIDAVEGNMISIKSSRIPVSRNTKDTLMQKVVENKLLKR
jgi:DNA-binding LytR/AlgR family response regulator